MSNKGNKVNKMKKKWGQYWMEDEGVLRAMVEAAQIKAAEIGTGGIGIKPEETVVEIGAGTGNLTYFLAQTGAQVLALEKDRDLIARLTKRLKRFKNVKVICADARFFAYPSNFKIVANLPYNITSFILRRLLTLKTPPALLILMLQKEVAQKLVARPGQKARSLLTILVKISARSKLLSTIPKEKFQPQPKVDSAIIKLTPRAPWGPNQEKLLKFIKLGFSAKRRQLKNNLKLDYNVFSRAKIDPRARAEDLSIKQWRKLYEIFSESSEF